MSEFDPNKDKIAVVVKEFTLKKKSEVFFKKYSEPYILSIAIDENGAKNPMIDFNILPFPHVKKGDKISFDGVGHLIYGPNNPGEFLAYSILFMESDKEIRDFGAAVEKIMKSEAINIGAKAILTAAPTYSTAINIIQKLMDVMAKQLQKNKDDELFRRNGSLLRDITPPYDILRTYESQNDFVHTKTSVIPLESNSLGALTKKVVL